MTSCFHNAVGALPTVYSHECFSVSGLKLGSPRQCSQLPAGHNHIHSLYDWSSPCSLLWSCLNWKLIEVDRNHDARVNLVFGFLDPGQGREARGELQRLHALAQSHHTPHIPNPTKMSHMVTSSGFQTTCCSFCLYAMS